jgi:hypothetical protein
MKKIILLAFCFLVLFSVPLLALQETEGTTTYNPAVVELILLGLGGLSVVGITQMIKAWLKATGILAYVISGVVSAAATAYVLTTTGGFTIPAFAGYTIFVFLAANGIYKAKT